MISPWEHALILTYGADLPFFERALARQLSAQCRNKIILSDWRYHLDACAVYAEGGRVRSLNQSYIAEGVHSPRAMHAKLILLANPERGRLLVGSGNLGHSTRAMRRAESSSLASSTTTNGAIAWRPS